MAREQSITYDFFGQGINGPWVPPNDERGHILKMVNCRVDERMNGIYKREGATDLLNATATGAPLAFGFFTEDVSGSIPYVFNLLYQVGSSAYVYDINTTTQSNLPVDTDNTGTLTLNTSRPGSVLSGIGDRAYLVSGTPAVYIPGDNTLYQLGVPTPALPVSNATTRVVSDASATNITYAYTLEHKVTGYESDYAVAPFSVTITANNETRADFTVATGHWTNIYRTLDGGSTLYYVGRVDGDVSPSATSHSVAYIAEAVLKDQPIGDIVGRRATPPSNASVAAFHNNRLFIADNQTLYVSESFNSDDRNLAYFNVTNLKLLDDYITALYSWKNELLVFTLRSTFVIRGNSVSEYRLSKLVNVGCISNQSIASNGQDLVYVSEEGVHVFTRNNQLISRPVDHILQPLLYTGNSNQIIASADWNPHTRQFIFTLTNDQPQPVVWEDAVTAADVLWVDAVTTATTYWQDAGLFSGNSLSAVVAWNPYLQGLVWSEYQFNQITGSGGLPFFIVHPHASNDYKALQQRHDFLIYYLNGADTTMVLQTFIQDQGTDGNNAFDAELIIGPIVPGLQQDTPKFVRAIGFGSIDQVPQGGSTSIHYLIDQFNVLETNYASNLKTLAPRVGLRQILTENTLRWLHLRILNTGDTEARRLLLRDFSLFFRELKYRAYL